MRKCLLNQIPIWYVKVIGTTEDINDEGFYTGFNNITFSDVTQIDTIMYPSNGNIVKEIFGDNCEFDAITFFADEIFDKNTYIYLSEPTEVNLGNCDYKIEAIKKSLNYVYYGLKRVNFE